MSQDPNTIDQVESYITGTVEFPLRVEFGLEATLSTDWLPDEYTIVNDKIVLDGADYDLSLLLDGKVAAGTSDAKRLYHTYSETNPDSLDDGWLSVEDEYFTERDRAYPILAVMGYTIDTSKDLKAIWPEDQEELDTMTVELYRDDTLVAPENYVVDVQGLWWVSESYDSLPVNVYSTDHEFKLVVVKVATESDLDNNNLLDSNIPIVDSALEDLVTGTGDLQLSILNTGADKCKGIPRAITLSQYQTSSVTLYPLDRNGDIVELAPTTIYSAYFTLRESAGGESYYTTSCQRSGDSSFVINMQIDQAGSYLGQLLIFNPDESLLLFVSDYYVSIKPTDMLGTLETADIESIIEVLSLPEYILDVTDLGSIKLIDTTLNNVTVILPTAVGSPSSTLMFKKLTDNSHIAIIKPIDGETIDGATELLFSGMYTTYHLISDGANWLITGAF